MPSKSPLKANLKDGTKTKKTKKNGKLEYKAKEIDPISAVGFVDYFSEGKGFGYIRTINKYIKNDRIYFHYSEIAEKRKSLRKNTKVKYQVKSDNFGSYATNIQMTSDQPLLNNISYGVIKSYDNKNGKGTIKTKTKENDILIIDFSVNNSQNVSLTTRLNMFNRKKIIGQQVEFELDENQFGDLFPRNIKPKINLNTKTKQSKGKGKKETKEKMEDKKDGKTKTKTNDNGNNNNQKKNFIYGVIIKYPLRNARENCGFISYGNGKKDVYFRGDDVKLKNANDFIGEGDEVKFEIYQFENLITGEKRKKAININVIKKKKIIVKKKRSGRRKSVIDFDNIKVPPSSKERNLRKKFNRNNNNNNNTNFRKKVTLNNSYNGIINSSRSTSPSNSIFSSQYNSY